MSQTPSARTERIAAALAPVLAPLDLVLEDVSVVPAGKRRLVQVLVDRVVPPDADPGAVVPPLDLDQVAEATRVVSGQLDETDAMGEQPYVLEVSSPGTERALTQPRHFRRNVGRLVEVRLPDAEPVTGRLVRADDEGFTLSVPVAKAADDQQDFGYDDKPRGAVQLEWNRASDDAGEDG